MKRHLVAARSSRFGWVTRETTNLANRPAYAKELTRLREACQQLVTEAKGDVN
ncbi:hypothetical protein GYB59_12380 [bacterium]|nr:hypothetical protein [bacterium]